MINEENTVATKEATPNKKVTVKVKFPSPDTSNRDNKSLPFYKRYPSIINREELHRFPSALIIASDFNMSGYHQAMSTEATCIASDMAFHYSCIKKSENMVTYKNNSNRSRNS